MPHPDGDADSSNSSENGGPCYTQDPCIDSSESFVKHNSFVHHSAMNRQPVHYPLPPIWDGSILYSSAIGLIADATE
jgi:hypothetical protein